MMEKGYMVEAGWSPTRASTVLNILLAGNPGMTWDQIDEFLDLNGVSDWEPELDYGSGPMIANDGNIYLPDNIYIPDDWQSTYKDLKNGYEVATLPPQKSAIAPTMPQAPQYPANSPQNPPNYYPAAPGAAVVNPPSQSATTPTSPAANTPTIVTPQPGMQNAAYTPAAQKPAAQPGTIFGIPQNYVLIGGAAVLAYFLFIHKKKKGRR